MTDNCFASVGASGHPLSIVQPAASKQVLVHVGNISSSSPQHLNCSGWSCLLPFMVALIPGILTRRRFRASNGAGVSDSSTSLPLAAKIARRHLLAVAVSLYPTTARAGLFDDGGTGLMYSGMETFRLAQDKKKVEESIVLFDKAAAAGYAANRLWQRGLSLYYADRFADGSKQFRDDVALNPTDTEESIWAMLCEARMSGFEKARQQMLVTKGERRPYMRAVYKLFRGDDEAESLAALQNMANGGGADEFYAALYLGLFAEARGETQDAKRYIVKSVASEYGKNSNDYMADLARVHLAVRGWRGKAEL